MEGCMMGDIECGKCTLIADSMSPWITGWRRIVNPGCPIHGQLANKDYQDWLLSRIDKPNKDKE